MQDIFQKKAKVNPLIKNNDRYEKLTLATSDIIWDWDLETDEIVWSGNYAHLFGWQLPEDNKLIAADSFSRFHPQDYKRVFNKLMDVIHDPAETKWQDEYRYQKADGSYAFVIDRGYVIRGQNGKAWRMVGAMQDHSEKYYQTELLALERKIFELSSNPEILFIDIIQQFLRGIEVIYPQMFTAVISINNGTIEQLIAPNIPDELLATFYGRKTSIEERYWEDAIRKKQMIVVKDIAADPLWVNNKELLLNYGLKSCYALPVIHNLGQVIGCFLIFHKVKAFDLSKEEFQIIERAANILRILMENRQSLRELKMTNERFDVIMKASNDLIWDWNLEKGIVYRDVEGVQKVYGITDDTTISDINAWIQRIHPDDRLKVQKTIKSIVKSTEQNSFELEYRFMREDGTYAFVYDRGILLRNEKGKPYRMIGAAHDITERKRLERELINKELEKQRAINQATIDTQEQERTEIGKELHDNVNQVLTTTKLYLELASSNPEMKDQLIEKSIKNVIYVINEIRQLSRSLMNPSLGDLGLIDALRDLAENIHFTKKLHLNLDLNEEVDSNLNENQKVMLFRIAQEILNNTIKHAQATTVDMKLDQLNDQVVLMIKDDGKGFDISKVKKGSGLKNIQNRVYLAGGNLEIHSKPGKGSTTIVKCPIKTHL
ncbi:PAS domain-containing protein [Chitinophagaceae bacterium LB-8]|uniref:histidine kinase n=1 Tax=Paraflavisolibacter caeni TaxID=2982496 RepID=A0A9X2XTT4_9BACT|nr:PAS domain-containing protein [Paraflavisolibacter caeni]MCU7548906.1 PAS domain-containing protein [Paraflavisolibacter caeni]